MALVRAGGGIVTWTFPAGQLQKISERLKRYPKAISRSTREELKVELTEAKRRTPVKFGRLRDSGRIEPAGETGWRIVFGGISIRGLFVDYAAYVHEAVDVFHKVGQAKYLESVLAESRAFLLKRIVARARAYVRGR